MFDLIYLFAAGAGYFIYTQVMRDPAPQTQAEEQKVAVKPVPKIAYVPLNKMLVRDRPDVHIVGKRKDIGYLGTPRYDVIDEATGTITPIYSTEPSNTMRLLQI